MYEDMYVLSFTLYLMQRIPVINYGIVRVVQILAQVLPVVELAVVPISAKNVGFIHQVPLLPVMFVVLGARMTLCNKNV